MDARAVHHQVEAGGIAIRADIMAILQDPVMQSILQQAKGDPRALQDHMKNPDIKNKVQKLMAAGVIRMG